MRHYQQVIVRGGVPTLGEGDTRACSEPQCGDPLYDRGACVRHFAEAHAARLERRAVESIFARIEAPDNDACWIWRGALNAQGYGVVSYRNEIHLVHRFVYEQTTREGIAGYQLDHLCRVHACCNPSHLEPVAPAENVRRHAVVIASCTRCNPPPIATGESLDDRLALWGVDRSFAPKTA